MSDKDKGTPSVKESAKVNSDSTKNNDAEKSPDELKQIASDQKGRATKAEGERDTATARVKELEAELKGKSDDGKDVSDENIKAMAEKHGVDPKFAQELADSIKSGLSQEVKASEEKLTEAIQEGNNERNQEKLDKAFDAAFNVSSEEYGDLKIDKDSVKDLYLARKGANADLTVADVLQTLYGAAAGQSSSEDDARGGDRGDGETIDFAKASKDPEAMKKIMADPKAKADYYKYRDANDI